MRELWFAVFACIAAAVLSVDSATTAGSNGASTVNAAGTKQFGEALVNLLQTMSVGQRRLIVMQGLPAFAKSNVPLICNGTPAIVAYTPSLKNDECFRISDPTLDSNLSCTCLDYLKPTEWHFKIKQNTATQETALVKSQTTDDPIEIDSMMFYGIAPRVTTVTIEGQGNTPVSLTLMPSPLPGTDTSTVKLIHSSLETTVENLYIKNIDFKGMNLSRGFIPEVPSNLTITSCNVGGVKSDLISSLQNLENLDLSYNQLPWIYLDFNADACLSGGCPIVSLNLSHNRLTALPLNLMGMSKLKTLDLTANSITNLTVSTDQYDSIKKTLSTLKVDPIQTDCINGTIQTVATASVCVRNATTAAAPTPAPQDNKSNSYLMYAVIGGCLVIAVLVFALVKKNACKSREDVISTKEPLDAYFDNTLSYDETHATISASLLNDPIIITNRLPYKDLRVANCISKGGFGLVYSGVYNRRRVAIKKIRPDRAGDIKQIESFLKEICLIATLNHPRIVEFIGVSWDTLRNLCAVTEFMDRGDLREVLHGFKLRNTPLTWETHKTSISLNIAEGLTYLHSLSPKIVHRDLKSKNVLLNNEMVAKLSDFGISRERHIEETHMTAGIGTSFWIAPEVLLGKDYDERADIFSFGVVLSEIDTDDYPYWNASNPNVGNKAQENMILQMVASGAMRPSFSDTCPRAILELADLCLQVEPSNRPTAAEVAYRLQQIVQFMHPPSSESYRSSDTK